MNSDVIYVPWSTPVLRLFHCGSNWVKGFVLDNPLSSSQDPRRGSSQTCTQPEMAATTCIQLILPQPHARCKSNLQFQALGRKGSIMNTERRYVSSVDWHQGDVHPHNQAGRCPALSFQHVLTLGKMATQSASHHVEHSCGGLHLPSLSGSQTPVHTRWEASPPAWLVTACQAPTLSLWNEGDASLDNQL